MRIVHIITRLIIGGAQENTLITCQGLAEAGHEVTLITGPALGPEGQLFDKTIGQGYKTLIVPQMRRAVHPVRDLIAYNHIKRLLCSLRPQIVHTHSAKAGILGRRAAFYLRPRPVILHTIHGLPFHPYQARWLNWFYIYLERRAARWTDTFISVADAMTRQSMAAGIGIGRPYITVYSAIAEQGFYRQFSQEQILGFRRRYGIPEDAVVLITVARLFMLKGHDFIISSATDLAQRFPNVIWLFVGDGNLADHYKAQISRLGLAHRFRFTGLLPPDQIPLAMQASDILVHCSLREGLARAIPQAMLCRRPVVAFNLDGTPELVNQTTGRLVRPGDVQGLVAACAELISDGQLRQRLGQAGWALTRERFDPGLMVRRIEAIYSQLSGGNLACQ